VTEPSTGWKLQVAWCLRRPDLVKMIRLETPADFDALRDQLYRDGQSFEGAESTLRSMFFPVPPPKLETAPEAESLGRSPYR
jgi:hypothetical protein